LQCRRQRLREKGSFDCVIVRCANDAFAQDDRFLFWVLGNLDRQCCRLFLRFLGMSGFGQAEGSSAVVAFVLDIVVLRQLRDPRGRAAKLTQLLQHDLGTAIVFFEVAVNLNHAVRQLMHISNILQVAGKDHHGEGANSKVLTEVKVCDSVSACLDAKNRSGHALRLADMSASLRKGNAFGDAKRREEQSNG
jgi:hypothetical protein